jgi:hypothetical protein
VRPPEPERGVRGPSVPSTALLAVVGGFLGFLAGFPYFLGIVIVAAGVATAVGVRTARSARLRAFAPGPLVLALGVVAVGSPLGLVPELVAGAAGLSFLVWLADDPARSPGGVGRASATILVPALAVGIAWSSALLLPAIAAPLGVAAGVLVFALVALAYLVARPGLFDREEAATY